MTPENMDGQCRMIIENIRKFVYSTQRSRKERSWDEIIFCDEIEDLLHGRTGKTYSELEYQRLKKWSAIVALNISIRDMQMSISRLADEEYGLRPKCETCKKTVGRHGYLIGREGHGESCEVPCHKCRPEASRRDNAWRY
jgi:hypothetical protein